MLQKILTVATHAFCDRWYRLPTELASAFRVSRALEVIRSRWPDTGKGGPPAEEPVFIFSAGWRSGSTLLQRLIVSSGEVHIWGEPLGESAFLPRLGKGLAAITDAWPPSAYFPDPARTPNDLASLWIANLTPPMSTLRDAHRAFYRKWLAEPALSLYSMQRWGLKETRLTIDHARYLKWLFPGARFFMIVRNPVDAYRSWKGNIWYSPWSRYFTHSPIIFARHWRLMAEDFLKGCGDVDGLMIRFEDMVDGTLPLDIIASHAGISHINPEILIKKIGSPRQWGAVPKKRIYKCERWLLRLFIGKDLLTEYQYLD